MSIRPRKRQRVIPDEERSAFEEAPFDDDLLETSEDEIEQISDTMAALEVLRRQFPDAAQVPPIILRSQIYNVLPDWTVVDQELEQERQKGSIRMIKLPASVDDYAYLLTEDYRACINAAFTSQQEKGVSEDKLGIFEQFREKVLPSCKEASVSHADLMRHLSSPSGQSEASTAITDQQFAMLMTTGLLTREVGRHNSYLFAVNGAGKLVTSITKGRKEFLAAIGRKRYKEVFLKDALKWKLRGSCLDSQWHIRDLLGRGSISSTKTTSGPLLRLAGEKRGK